MGLWKLGWMRKILIKNESSHTTDTCHRWLDKNEWDKQKLDQHVHF